MFVLCTTYRPPNARVAVWDYFNVRIERAMEVNLNNVVLGDVNENLLNNNITNLKNIILFNNIDNVIKEPTRLTATSTTLIDPILFSNSFGNYKAGCLDIENNISDHKATYIHIQSIFNTNF